MKRLTRSTRPRLKQSTKRSSKRPSKSPAGRAPVRRAAPGPERDGNTEQQILDGAHTVFLRHGTSGARMQDIAAEAGVNQALLHYYFRSKEQLARATFERAGSQLMPAIIRVMASE